MGAALGYAFLFSAALFLLAQSSPQLDEAYYRAKKFLESYPVIDGHNDLAEQLREVFMNQVQTVDLTKNYSGADPKIYGPSWHTDIPRLKAGGVGGQFWSAYMDCSSQYADATRTFLDQIDVIRQFVAQYSTVFKFATTADDIEHAITQGYIASMIGVEGGHAIDSSLGTLRQLYQLGARYMTLTHTCDTPWAHSCVDPTPLGLNDFGVRVVHEMNRLGMLVDISHVSNYTMSDVLDVSKAPVIFSHSSAYTLCANPRNVPDNILMRMPQNDGIVMVNFFPYFISCSANASYLQVADHIDHIVKVAGVDHVGIGSDFDGIPVVPVGLEDVSKYPNLFAELIRRGYSEGDLQKIASQNLLRVLRAAEQVSQSLSGELPDNTHISPQPNSTCRPDF